MSWDALYADVAPPEENPTWGDYGQTIKSGGGGALAGAASGLKYLYELGGGEGGNVAKLLDSLQGAGNAISDDAAADMTESGRRRFAAGVTTPEFWEHPISSLAMKATGQIPNVVAMATPMGLFNDARMAVAAASAVGGTLSSGELLNGFYQKVAEASDETLQKQSPLYREMRERGTDEREARQTYTHTMLGLKPAIAFLFGAADGVLGPVGNVIRGVKGGVRHGIGRSAAGGAASELGDEGYGAYGGQKAEIEGGLRKEFDVPAIIDQALTGAALGGVLGGVSGVGGGKGKAKADEIKAKRQQGAGEEDAAVEATAQGAQVGAAEPVGPAAATITPKSAKGVTVLPDPISPNQAEAEAIVDLQQPKPPAAAPAPPAAAPAPPPTQPVPPPVPPAPAAQEAVQPQQTPPSPLPLGGALAAAPPTQAAPPPAAVAPPPAAAPVTPQVTPSPAAMNAQAAMMPAEALQQPAPVTGTAGVGGVSAQAAPVAPVTEAAPRAPRVLPSLTAESKTNEVAQQVAQQETATKAAQVIKAADQIDKEPGTKNLSKGDRATIEARGKTAEEIFEKHHVELAMPESPSARREMAAKLQTVLNAAAEQGLVLRENLPDHILKHYSPPKGKKSGDFPITEEERTSYLRSVPTKVGDKAMSAHVRYLRELVGIQKSLLGTKFGPKSKERARVAQFVTEHNTKALDLMGVRRKEEGAAVAEQYQGTVEDAERRQAGAGMKSVDAAGKGVNVSPQSAGPASEGRVLGANEKAVIAAEALARLQQKEADKAAAEGKAAPPAEVKTEAKPKLSKVEQAKAAAARLADKYTTTPVVKSETEVSNAPAVEISVSEAKTPAETTEEKPAEIVVAEKPQEEKPAEKTEEIPPVAEAPQGQLIGKEAPSTEVTPEVTPERVRLPPTKIEEGTHEGMVPVLRKRNALRKWVNELSDEDYAKVNPDTHRVLVDASSMRTLAMVETDLAQQVGRAPEKPVSTGTIERTPQQRILDAKEAKEAAAEAEALAARAAAAAARKAKAKPMATPEQRKEALAKLLAGKKSEKKALPKRAAQMKQYAEDEMGDLAPPENWEQDLAGLAAVDEANAAVVPSDLKVALEARGRLGDIVYTDSASEVLRNLDMSSLGVKTRYLQDFVRRRLTEVLQNVPIYVVDSEVMARVWANDPRGSPPAGYYDTNRRLDGSTVPHIVVDAATLDNPRTFVHVVIHEAMHAALAHKLNTNAKFAEQIEMLREELDWQTKSEPREGFRAAADYAITDVHEFVSEVMSNPDLQYVLANMPLRPKLAQKLGLHNAPMKPWTLWGAFLEKAREVIGFKPAKRVHNFLDEAFKVIAPQLEAVRSEAVQAGTFQQYHAPGTATLRPPPNLSPFDRLTAMLDESRQPMRKMAARIDLAAAGHEVATRAAAAGINTGGKLARAKDKISSLWMMARRNTHLFGPSNMLNRLFEARAFMERAKDTILKKYGGNEASLAIAKAEREHPEAMARAKQTLFDASLHDVNLDGSNDHLGKDKLMGVQAKNEIARLQSEWNNPALDPVRETLRGAIKFFRDIHNAVSRETIKNVLAEANIHDNALVDRIHNGGVTEADKAWMDNKVVSALNEVQSLKRRHGSYVPFRRYGNFVSAAEHELSVPSNATKINDNTLQFVDPTGKGGNARARAAVKGYLRSNSHTPQGNKLTPAQINKVWVDKADPSKILPAEDVNAIPAYRVAMQTQHVEFHETQAEAQRSAADLQQSGLTNARNHAREDAYKNERNIQGAMGTILRSLEKQQRYIDADATQKLAMREMFHDLTLGLSGTTSIKSSMNQRRNVAGMSHDLGRVTSDYARMTANHLAKLQHRPKIDSIFAEMRAYMKDHQYDNDAIRRDEVYKEFINRVYGRAADTAEEHKTGAVTRLLQMSRLSRLAGPSFHIINAHEPWTTSLPMIGGRHGFGAAAKALTDAYNFIGGRAGVTAGLRDTAKAYTNDGGFTDYVKMFKDTIAASRIAGPDKISRMQDMIDYMDARNLYANSAIFEVGKFANPQGNLAGRALDRADLMANQVGSAIEAINRTVTGLTAYNLEYKKNGGNHEAAMHYAYSTAHETMGDYSHWNAAPAFNTGFGRVALQFKKFGHKTYYLLGNTMGNALRGDREAMKQLAGVLVTHGLVAGALGMPTEPLKVALMAANMVGATGFTPDDYEYAVRQLAARLAGQKGGEIISKGLYRGIGIEVSGRMGFDTLLTHGAPKGQKANDIKAFLFDTLAGAPAGYLLDQVAAAQALAKGDVATFVEKASPLRTVGDIAKAYTGATGPKTGPSGKTTQEQFNAWETAVRAVGFTPSSVAEHGAMRGTVARESKRLSADRSELINAWIDASGAKKVEAQRAVQEFNSGRPKTEQISQKDLSAAARRRETEKPKTHHGITVSKRTKEIYERAEGVFNP